MQPLWKPTDTVTLKAYKSHPSRRDRDGEGIGTLQISEADRDLIRAIRERALLFELLYRRLP